MPATPVINACSRATRTRAGTVVALLAMVLMQLTGATHQYSHALDDLSSSCEVCLQLDRDDATPLMTVAATATGVSAEVLPAADTAVFVSQPNHFYRSRAPPRI